MINSVGRKYFFVSISVLAILFILDDSHSQNISDSLVPNITNWTAPSSCSIVLTWVVLNEIQDNQTIDHFLVSWNDSYTTSNDVVSATATLSYTYEIGNLADNASYDITVDSILSDSSSVSGSAVKGNTLFKVPSNVTSLNATDVTSSQIHLKWLTSRTDLCPNVYKVTWNAYVYWDDFKLTQGEDRVSEEEYIMTNLIPFSNYTISVAALGSNDIEGDNQVITVDTPSGEPGPPIGVSSVSTTSSSINVSWDPPPDANGILGPYVISWEIPGVESPQESLTNETSYTIESLRACGNYVIEVRATTDDGGTVGSAGMTDATTKAEVPPEIEVINVENVTSTSITLSWTPPDTLCEVIEYTLWSEGDVNWSEEYINDTRIVPGNVSSFTAMNLIPWTRYTFHLQSLTTGGHSNYSSGEATTEQDAPTAPQNLTNSERNATSLMIMWEEPSAINGEHLSYKVSWFYSEGDVNESVTNQTSYLIDGLISCSNYTIWVSGFTDGGTGSTSSLVSETGAEYPPAPFIVSCDPVSSTSVKVAWLPPKSSCMILSYELSSTETILWKDENNVDTFQVNTTEENFTLKRLKPYSRCESYVVARTVAGEGPQSKKCTTQTFEAVPGPPEELTCVEDNVQKTSLEITWMPPKNINGILEAFFVYLGDNEVAEVGLIQDAEQLPYRYSLQQLKSNSQYNISVAGKTGAGIGESASVIGSTAYDSSLLVLWLVLLVLVVGASLFAAYHYRDKIRYKFRQTPQANPIPHNQDEDLEEFFAVPILLKDLKNYSDGLKNKRKLQREYEYLSSNSYQGSVDEGDKIENRLKNRYSNILPYDATRVILRDSLVSYINASYISSFSKKKMFIATQRPKVNTLQDFLTMVWQQNVRTIVMLTSCNEKDDQENCSNYWPRPYERNLVIDNYTVANKSEESNVIFSARKLDITKAPENRVRSLDHFQYTSWPSSGAPERVESMLEFLTNAKRSIVKSDGRVLVHCSGGAGRTGLFIALWNLIEQIDSGRGNISVLSEVLNLRKQRMMMVQNKEQYRYLYECISAYSDNRLRWNIDPEGLHQRKGGSSSSNSETSTSTREAKFTNAAFEPSGDDNFIGNLI